MEIRHAGNFSVISPFPGIYHIMDAMGVCMTLLTGSSQALLIDTGYGIDNVFEAVRMLTDKPLTVLLTHGHHDHLLGAYWFPETYMFTQDLPDFYTYSSPDTRKRVAEQAEAKGLNVPADYLFRPISEPKPMQEGPIDLGGRTAEVVLCPGHTPGSAVIWLPAERLLLTGDDWNPCTWLFFSRALDLRSYHRNMLQLTDRLKPEWLLCPHQHRLFPASMLRDFLQGFTEEHIAAAYSVSLSSDPAIQPVHCGLTQDQYIVFDRNKLHRQEQMTKEQI